MIALWLPGTPYAINYCCEGGLAHFRSSAKVSCLPTAAQPRLALSGFASILHAASTVSIT